MLVKSDLLSTYGTEIANNDVLKRNYEQSSIYGCWIIVNSLVNGLVAELFKIH